MLYDHPREILVQGYRLLLIHMRVLKRDIVLEGFATPYFVTGLSSWLIEAMSDAYGVFTLTLRNRNNTGKLDRCV